MKQVGNKLENIHWENSLTIRYELMNFIEIPSVGVRRQIQFMRLTRNNPYATSR